MQSKFPGKDAERRSIDEFLAYYNRQNQCAYRVESRPDKINRESHHGKRDIDAIAIDSSKSKHLAIEHTFIETIEGQMSDDAAFIRAFTELEELLQNHQAANITVCFNRNAPPKLPWHELRRELVDCIDGMISSGQQQSRIEIRNIKPVTLKPVEPGTELPDICDYFDISISLDGPRGVARYKPPGFEPISEQQRLLAERISNKAEQMKKYSPAEFVRILLLSSADFVLTSERKLRQAFALAWKDSEQTVIAGFDEVYLLQHETGRIYSVSPLLRRMDD